MKKFYALLVASISAMMLFIFSGCDDFFGPQSADEEPFVEVSTAQELQEGGWNISLKNDIDFGGEIFNPIYVNIFNGNGYTISNAVITATSIDDSASFFSEVFNRVQDVTFENITISAEKTSYAAVVLALPSSRFTYRRASARDEKDVKEIVFDNVHIKDCNIIVNQGNYAEKTYVGGILGSGTMAKMDSWDTDHILEEDTMERVITNCSVTETEITVRGYDPAQDGKYNIGPAMNVGGVCGSADKIIDCSATYNTISVTSNQRYSEPYVGGLTGCLNEEGIIEGCSVYANAIEASALFYRHISLVNGYECSDVNMGGLFGDSREGSSVSFCSVDENIFSAKSVGGYYLGGIGGDILANVSQCRIVNNVFEGIGYLDGEDKSGDPWTRNIGGVSASSAEVTFSSIFTYGNRMTTTLSLDDVQTVDPTGSCVGFAKTTPEAVFMYCATGANEMSAGTTDEFATAALENVDQCYVTSETYGNARELPFINESDWFAEDQISSLLNLMGTSWEFTAGELPQLVN